MATAATNTNATELQFRFNADLPDPLRARPPEAFPEAQLDPCARITTRIYMASTNQVRTVPDVLVKTKPRHIISRPFPPSTTSNNEEGDDSESSSEFSNDDEMSEEDASMPDVPEEGHPSQSQSQSQNDENNNNGEEESESESDDSSPSRAYWLQRTLRDAIYGAVKYAIVLKKRVPANRDGILAEWELTTDACAVKEMDWQHIRRDQTHLAEDPIKEVAALQYLQRWYSSSSNSSSPSPPSHNNNTSTLSLPLDQVDRALLDSKIMLPLDILTDDRFLYSVMPYCDGGELFDRLDQTDKFTEGQARYWMHQIIMGLDNLQKAGICHRDMSLENLLVHKGVSLIIDMGMCLKVPYEEDPESQLEQQQHQLEQQQQPSLPNTNTHATEDGNTNNATEDGNTNNNMQGLIGAFGNVGVNGTNKGQQQQHQQQQIQQQQIQQQQQQKMQMETMERNQRRRQRRCMILPQGTCGKWHYMSPEIYQDSAPFDGFAVDMWATGVILFLMLTGFPPWERPCRTDERFKYMTQGYLVQMLTEWNVGLSGDAMDLLQRMLWIDPNDRLSLAQVRAHPWMTNGPLQPPSA